MNTLLIAIITQTLCFLPLAFGISISYHVLRATDMTIDGSFVLGAAIFARIVTLGFSPIIALFGALLGGASAGMLAAFIQRDSRVEPLLAGILATFILSSLTLILMGKPNISLLAQPSLVSFAFEKNLWLGWMFVAGYSALFCALVFLILQTRFGLMLRALGDNSFLLKKIGKPIEWYRLAGFALTNLLAASAGCLTAQTVGYADIGMGFGMTLTGVGAIILGQQVLQRIRSSHTLRLGSEFIACLLGVILYFFAVNFLFRLNIDPIYLKMLLGILLVIFLRASMQKNMERMSC